jgi:hypothetical protein
MHLLSKNISYSGVKSAVKLLAVKVSSTDIWQFIQMKNHFVVNFVTNLLHRAGAKRPTGEKFMLKKLA